MKFVGYKTKLVVQTHTNTHRKTLHYRHIQLCACEFELNK